MKRFKIYSIINDINKKVYIGFTSKSLKWRLTHHFSDVRHQYSPTRKIHKAIMELGEKHFSITLLYESDNKDEVLGKKEQEFIETYDSINNGYNSRKGGGGKHLTNVTRKPVDVYNKDGEFIQTFPSRVAVAEFIGCNPGIISTAIANADNDKGSQVHGYWVCHSGHKPGYKVRDTTGAATKAARRVNIGKKRPEHAVKISKIMNEKHCNYHTPCGTYTLTEGGTIWGRDMLMAWCNHPDQIISKMMVLKSKKLNSKDHNYWIGKTRREVGFYRL